MSKMIGAIYAVPENLVDRLFCGNKNIFVKITGRDSTKISPKHKIIFYASHGNRKLVGEGIVETVEFLNPAEVLLKYSQELFLKEDEFIDYVGKRQKILVFKLSRLKKYQNPIQSKRVITMGGKYLTEKEYKSLIGSQSG
jgi:hypothetical protein